MKKMMMGLLALYILSACGGKYLREAEKGEMFDPKEYGILVFSVTFAENKYQEKELYFDLVGDMGGSRELRVDPDDDLIFAFVAKEGYYRIRNIKGVNNSPAVTRAGSTKEEREIYSERQWSFAVEAGKFNYVGNIFIKDFDHQEGLNTKFQVSQEVYTLSAQIELRSRLADLVRLKDEKPVYATYKFPLITRLMEEADSDKARALEHISKAKQQQAKEGYGDFAWGVSIEEVKNFLEQKKQDVLVLSSSHLVDNTRAMNPVEYYFTDQEGRSLLNKVVVHLDKAGYDQVMTSIIQKYGKAAKQEGESLFWFTSFSKITLENKESELLLTYEGVGVEQAVRPGLDDLIK